MKRVCVVLCALVIMMISGCSSNSSKVYATEKGTSVAKQAIEVADSFLDGEIDYKEANEKLSELRADMEYYTELPQETADEKRQYACDSGIATYITILNHNILMDDYEGDNDTYKDVKETRNKIAELANLDQR